MKSPAPSYVYFIKPVGREGPVKIGCSILPTRRLEEFSVWSPFPLEIVLTVSGDLALERNLHECLAGSHSHNEWFRPTFEVLDLLHKLKSGVPVHEAIDLAARKGGIRPKAKRPVWFREHRSYLSRIMHAKKRGGRPNFHCGEPHDVSRIMSEWRNAMARPDDEKIARLEAFIRDPALHGIMHRKLRSAA